MNDFQISLVISGSIFAVMMASNLGRREFSWHKWVFPILSMIGFGIAYLAHLPLVGGAPVLYLVGVLIGAGFGVWTTVATTLERGTDGKVYATTGASFVTAWVLAGLVRVCFVWAVTYVSAFREQVGMYMQSHEILPTAIAPFFVLMAGATVIGRSIAVKVRADRLPADRRPAAGATPTVTPAFASH